MPHTSPPDAKLSVPKPPEVLPEQAFLQLPLTGRFDTIALEWRLSPCIYAPTGRRTAPKPPELLPEQAVLQLPLTGRLDTIALDWGLSLEAWSVDSSQCCPAPGDGTVHFSRLCKLVRPTYFVLAHDCKDHSVLVEMKGLIEHVRDDLKPLHRVPRWAHEQGLAGLKRKVLQKQCKAGELLSELEGVLTALDSARDKVVNAFLCAERHAAERHAGPVHGCATTERATLYEVFLRCYLYHPALTAGPTRPFCVPKQPVIMAEILLALAEKHGNRPGPAMEQERRLVERCLHALGLSSLGKSNAKNQAAQNPGPVPDRLPQRTPESPPEHFNPQPNVHNNVDDGPPAGQLPPPAPAVAAAAEPAELRPPLPDGCGVSSKGIRCGSLSAHPSDPGKPATKEELAPPLHAADRIDEAEAEAEAAAKAIEAEAAAGDRATVVSGPRLPTPAQGVAPPRT